ncbi:MAG: 50S ribosomal protein L28 [Patescibacteria group bacterium]
MSQCEICGKSPQTGFNRPHSLHRTKRLFKPNIQKKAGRLICAKCLRTLNKTKS